MEETHEINLKEILLGEDNIKHIIKCLIHWKQNNKPDEFESILIELLGMIDYELGNEYFKVSRECRRSM